jgi:hypothetical protein
LVGAKEFLDIRNSNPFGGTALSLSALSLYIKVNTTQRTKRNTNNTFGHNNTTHAHTPGVVGSVCACYMDGKGNFLPAAIFLYYLCVQLFYGVGLFGGGKRAVVTHT